MGDKRVPSAPKGTVHRKLSNVSRHVEKTDIKNVDAPAIFESFAERIADVATDECDKEITNLLSRRHHGQSQGFDPISMAAHAFVVATIRPSRTPDAKWMRIEMQHLDGVKIPVEQLQRVRYVINIKEISEKLLLQLYLYRLLRDVWVLASELAGRVVDEHNHERKIFYQILDSGMPASAKFRPREVHAQYTVDEVAAAPFKCMQNMIDWARTDTASNHRLKYKARGVFGATMAELVDVEDLANLFLQREKNIGRKHVDKPHVRWFKGQTHMGPPRCDKLQDLGLCPYVAQHNVLQYELATEACTRQVYGDDPTDVQSALKDRPVTEQINEYLIFEKTKTIKRRKTIRLESPEPAE